MRRSHSSGFDPAMAAALEADAEKLRTLGADPGPTLEDDDGSCWNCGGDGYAFDCIDGSCADADIGCDLCERPCWVCQA